MRTGESASVAGSGKAGQCAGHAGRVASTSSCSGPAGSNATWPSTRVPVNPAGRFAQLEPHGVEAQAAIDFGGRREQIERERMGTACRLRCARRPAGSPQRRRAGRAGMHRAGNRPLSACRRASVTSIAASNAAGAAVRAGRPGCATTTTATVPRIQHRSLQAQAAQLERVALQRRPRHDDLDLRGAEHGVRHARCVRRQAFQFQVQIGPQAHAGGCGERNVSPVAWLACCSRKALSARDAAAAQPQPRGKPQQQHQGQAPPPATRLARGGSHGQRANDSGSSASTKAYGSKARRSCRLSPTPMKRIGSFELATPAQTPCRPSRCRRAW
jgi:hypothetical protein